MLRVRTSSLTPGSSAILTASITIFGLASPRRGPEGFRCRGICLRRRLVGPAPTPELRAHGISSPALDAPRARAGLKYACGLRRGLSAKVVPTRACEDW